jgi:hypothetical protein
MLQSSNPAYRSANLLLLLLRSLGTHSAVTQAEESLREAYGGPKRNLARQLRMHRVPEIPLVVWRTQGALCTCHCWQDHLDEGA